MRRKRNTKIVATLGPASRRPETLEMLFRAGVDVFRLNFSHGTHADHEQAVTTIRDLEARTGRPIGILMDLQGPKLRVGDFSEGKVILEAGQQFRLDLDQTPGDKHRVYLPHPEVLAVLSPGDDLLLDDGKLRLRVRECSPEGALTEVETGGPLSDHKGVNVPGTILPISPITEKDRKDLEFGLELGVDWVALSFVQRVADIAEARKLIDGRAALLSKLEKPSAIEDLDHIIEQSDAVMVARGDLGVEMPPEVVPSLQKRIVRHCRVLGKPVIVATQMLESMIKAPTPTRAEASDVATAVYDGADAVMLSGETAVGEYPLHTVKIMNRIIERVEHDASYRRIMDSDHPEPMPTAADAITKAAGQVAQTIGAAAIVTFSTSGSTTMRAARERPVVPILGLTPKTETARRLTFLWGVHNVVTGDATSVTDMVIKANASAMTEEFAQQSERLVIVAGVPFGHAGTTNMLRISIVGN